MRPIPVWMLTLLVAGCATIHGDALASQQGHRGPSGHKTEEAAVPSGEAGRPVDAPSAPAVGPRVKTSASGATPAEVWSPELGAALRRHAEAPTVRNEIELAQALRDAGILDQAYDHYRAAARMNPREAAAWDGLARVWRDWGYARLGLGDAHRAVWAAPMSPVVRNTLGTILQLLGRNKEAREQYARAAALDPAAAYAHFNLGLVCALQQDYLAAAEAFERASTADPSLSVARNRAADARRRAADGMTGKEGTHERR